MLRHALTYLISAFLIHATPAIALASDKAHGDGAGHDPSIFEGGSFESIFAVVLFLLLLLVLGKFAWGPILSGLQKREEYIRQSIEDADKAKADAEASLKDYQEKLAQSQQEARDILEKGRADANKLADELKKNAQEEAGNIRAQTQRDIEQAKKQAISEIHEQVAVLATNLAGKIIGKTLNLDDQKELLQESLNQLQDSDI